MIKKIWLFVALAVTSSLQGMMVTQPLSEVPTAIAVGAARRKAAEQAGKLPLRRQIWETASQFRQRMNRRTAQAAAGAAALGALGSSLTYAHRQANPYHDFWDRFAESEKKLQKFGTEQDKLRDEWQRMSYLARARHGLDTRARSLGSGIDRRVRSVGQAVYDTTARGISSGVGGIKSYFVPPKPAPEPIYYSPTPTQAAGFDLFS